LEYNWLSLLPPLVAIALAIASRLVYFSLFFGLWFGWTIINNWNPVSGLASTLDCIIEVFTQKGSVEILAFCLFIGALLSLTQRSGGVKGFVDWIMNTRLIQGRRSANLLSFIIGCLIFIEANINCLLVGSISRPFFDRLKISREKLAYICDSTSAPVCVLLPLNAWGAFILGLLIAQDVKDPLIVLIKAVPLNFYAIATLLLLLIIILTQKDFGPMAKAEKRALLEGKLIRDGAVPMMSAEITSIPPKKGIKVRAYNMIIPIGIMMLMMPVSLYITGEGNILKGSGSRSVLWAISTAILAAIIMYLVQRILSLKEISQLVIEGAAGLMPLILILVLAFALGNTCKVMGTGEYTAKLASFFLSPKLFPALIFFTSCIIAFSTGTSWGTFAIMTPFIVPLSTKMGISLPLLLGAVLGGGVFGDHCSPISDTTIVSSMASASDHIDHVRTQLPYALTAAVFAFMLFILFAFL
jgi:tetracycline resistance efflux pump